MTCIDAGSGDAIILHRARQEPLCPTCQATVDWLERVEMERFGHGETRYALLEKVKREHARMLCERWAS